MVRNPTARKISSAMIKRPASGLMSWSRYSPAMSMDDPIRMYCITIVALPNLLGMLVALPDR